MNAREKKRKKYRTRYAYSFHESVLYNIQNILIIRNAEVECLGM